MTTRFMELPKDFKVNGSSAQLKIKTINCGKKGCTKCPHGEYGYIVYRDTLKTVKEFYIGQVKA